MKKQLKLDIEASLNRALDPPAKRKPSPALNAVLAEYAPAEPLPKTEPVREIETGSVKEQTGSVEPPPPLQTEPVAKVEPVAKAASVRILPDNAPHLRLPYEILDALLPKLKPAPRTILEKLYRQSAGFYSETCNISIPKLASYCKIGETQVRRYLKELEDDGYIERLGDDVTNLDFGARGVTFRVLLPQMPPPRNRTGSENRTGFKTEPNKDKDQKKDQKGSGLAPPDPNCELCHGSKFEVVEGKGARPCPRCAGKP
jgi:hypothetical protein